MTKKQVYTGPIRGTGWRYDPTPSKRRVKPAESGGLDALGEILEQARGDLGTAMVEVCFAEIHALGTVLRRIAAGEDARHIFLQHGARGTQSALAEKQTVAFVYLVEKVKGHTEAQAIARAATHFESKSKRKLSATTVRQYVKLYGGKMMKFLPLHVELKDLPRNELEQRIAEIQKRQAAGAHRGKP